MLRFNPVYRLCPNCGGLIDYERLHKGLPCRSCLPRDDLSDRDLVLRALEAGGRLAGLRWVYMLDNEFKLFSDYFRLKTGAGLWSAQASWARRLLNLDSFTIIAPTGVGKTTLLSVYAAYRAEVSGWRVLYLVPTGNLARLVYERIRGYTGGVVTYYSTMPAKAREEALKAIEEGDYRVLVVTTGFLQKRFNMLTARSPFNLVIVDDVDSVLRDSRNVERILVLLGYDESLVKLALELVRTRVRFLRALSIGDEELSRSLGEKLASLESALRKALKDIMGGQLVVASATGRPRGLKHLVFKELLNFEVGGGGDYLRNVIDSYVISEDPLGAATSIAGRLGSGGIVFVSQYLGRRFIDEVVGALKASGLRVGKAISGSWKAITLLERGELDVVVSVASRYGVAVRGLDAPRVIRYALFLGAPAKSMSVEEALLNPRRLERILIQMVEEGVSEAEELLGGLRRLINSLEDPSVVSIALRKGVHGGKFEVARRAYERVLEWVKVRVGELERFRIGPMVFVKMGDSVQMLIPDVLTYIQASGRTSRLLEGRMTLGLSVVIEPLRELLEALEERLKWLGRFTFRSFYELDLDEVVRLLEESRRGGGMEVRVRTALLIVESPTKARTIAWFWGRPSRRRVGKITVYETSALDGESGSILLLQVVATRGHLFDLVENLEGSVYGVIASNGSYAPVYDYIKRCSSCGHQFTSGAVCPRCGSSELVDSRLVVDVLRKLAMEVDEVIIATDPDMEGEKIAWDVYLALKPYNSNIRRARFHEVTRDAVLEALRNPSPINVKAVEAQITRRIVDRWVGYSVSEHLQRVYGLRWLGAGRVQSPVLSWVTSRYEEWVRERGYLVCYKLEAGSRVCLYTKDRGEAERLASIDRLKVVSVTRWTETVSPPPPYTTDSLLYDASLRLGLTVEKAMRVAQELFESGLITYHRTDSTRVSSTGIGVARAYMEMRGLLELFKPRSWGEGGAHEAIRPTRPLSVEDVDKAVAEGSLRIPIRLTGYHRALYDLIFRRFMASQATEAEVLKARVELEAGGEKVVVEGVGGYERRGFTVFYEVHEVKPWMLEVTPSVELRVVESTVRRASRVTLYTTGDLVKLMKEKGIGRPSTYSKAIEANRRHGYIVLSKKRGYVIPTKRGVEIANYLRTHFTELTSEELTRELEEKLDLIENDGVDPNLVLSYTLNRLVERIRRVEGILGREA